MAGLVPAIHFPEVFEIDAELFVRFYLCLWKMDGRHEGRP
jgi:hypothetical protein